MSAIHLSREVQLDVEPARYRLRSSWGRAHARNLLLGLIASMSVGSLSSPVAGQTLQPALGWQEIQETRLGRVCPPNGFGGSTYRFADSCRYVTEAWNSAVFDKARNRLIIWGGGHGDYVGNELYTLELNTLTVNRLTDPGLPVVTSGCQETLENGSQANARHTYDGLAYLEHVDRMFVFGGSLSWCGFFSQGTWTFDFTTVRWEKRSPSGPVPRAVPGIVTGYDPNSRKVFLHDDANLYSYEFESDRYRHLASGAPIDYHMTGAIDPTRRRFVIVGAGRVYVYDIGPRSWYTRKTLRTTGGDAIVNSSYPGLAYDPVTDRIVAWNGGDSVYSLDLDTGTWAATAAAGGPGPALGNGTFKRWSYSPTSGVFVLVNSMHGNAWAFRLTPIGAKRSSGSP
jgi:hypothetical protein